MKATEAVACERRWVENVAAGVMIAYMLAGGLIASLTVGFVLAN